jgi:DNA polymerase-3 subunit beta
MKFIISSSILLKNLQFLGSILNTNNTLPILDNFLFEIDNNKLNITSSDLETSLSCEMTIDSSITNKIAIPAKLLTDILRSLPEQPLTFSINDNNTIEINSSNGKYAIAYMDGSEYPKLQIIEDASELNIDSISLQKIISSTLFASGNDDLRPVMSGVFFQINSSNSCFVATDAHKLVKYSRSDINSPESVEFIIPNKPLTILKNIFSDDTATVKILFNKSNAIFNFANFKLFCRLIEGKYPNYDAVIPKENPNVLEIDRNLLLQATKRASIFSSKSTHQIKLDIKGNSLKVSAEDLDFNNKSEEILDCNYDGEDIIIGFNSRFINEMLNNLECNSIKIELSSPNRAGIISPIETSDQNEEILMLVMPIMLN